MNFDEAIAAHSAWKQKLAIYLTKPDKSIDAEKLALDNQCELGKWIHSQSGLAGAAFQELKKDHANFHKAASDVVKRADAGQKVTEEVALGAASPYAACSSRVVSALMRMKRENTSAA